MICFWGWFFASHAQFEAEERKKRGGAGSRAPSGVPPARPPSSPLFPFFWGEVWWGSARACRLPPPLVFLLFYCPCRWVFGGIRGRESTRRGATPASLERALLLLLHAHHWRPPPPNGSTILQRSPVEEEMTKTSPTPEKPQRKEEMENTVKTSPRMEAPKEGAEEEEKGIRCGDSWRRESSRTVHGRVSAPPARTHIPIAEANLGKGETSAAAVVGVTVTHRKRKTKGKAKGGPTSYAKREKKKDGSVCCRRGREKEGTNRPRLLPPPLDEKTNATRCRSPPPPFFSFFSYWLRSLSPSPPLARFPAFVRIRFWGGRFRSIARLTLHASHCSSLPCRYTSETEPLRQTATQFAPRRCRRLDSTHPSSLPPPLQERYGKLPPLAVPLPHPSSCGVLRE